MSPTLYLLDTNILLLLLRGQVLGRYIDQTYGLSRSPFRSHICIVSHGEIWDLAKSNGWGEKKRTALQKMLEAMVTIDINDAAVIRAYVDLREAARKHPKGSQENIGENDFWIAAAAMASQTTLLTCDQDFDVLVTAGLKRIFIPQTARLVSDLPP